MTNIIIAPATHKKAEKNGIALATKPVRDVEVLTATHKGRLFSQEGTTAPEFLTAVLAAFAYEDEAFDGIEADEAVKISQEPDDEQGLPGEFVAHLIKGGKPIGTLARDPDLADLLVSLKDEDDPVAEYAQGLREDAEPEEEEAETGSVVPDKFKQRYREAGHAGHCGDWLALTLNDLCQITDGKKVVTDLDRLEAIATANDVDAARVDKLGTATRGWQGRYRMTVRNMLTKKVADKGFLFVPDGAGVKGDTELKAPKAWCEKNATRTKPKKVVAKDEGAGKASAKTVAKKTPTDSPKAVVAHLEAKDAAKTIRKPTQAEKLAAAKAKAQGKK